MVDFKAKDLQNGKKFCIFANGFGKSWKTQKNTMKTPTKN
jgi:hypothetical protein